MKLSDLEYDLPLELIAQRPLENRSASKMLVLNRATKSWEHRFFLDLPRYLNPNDYLVLNHSKVIKARLLGTRDDTGGKIEVFLLQKITKDIYECMVRLTATKKVGVKFSIGRNIKGTIKSDLDESGRFLVELNALDQNLDKAIELEGRVPLPPYIDRPADVKDDQQYQTVYAANEGSVAAPTAGLHFTQDILKQIQSSGVDVRKVTLHVGLGTFQPIKVSDLAEHKMHEEFFDIEEEDAKEFAQARDRKRRIVAVGTTTVRALESAARGIRGSTEIFIKPGHEFYWVDSMLTNFHQPRSSLLALMCAFVGDRDLLMRAYADAIKEKYRFFSYGDCMLVL